MEDIPAPTLTGELTCEPGEHVILMEAWMPPYRDDYADRSVNKTVTLPRWLKNAAEERKLNFLRVLQEGLLKQLGLETQNYGREVKDSDDVHAVPGQDDDSTNAMEQRSRDGA